ncbi:MAG: hypothetical protein CVV16_03180 [Gammaproteobacteria bacterium HGW-Gammaproteobacteria-6]|nr:MAG: hypothetical protein CVV16_03180 [Gammaproteobacteria bacterium HGW-Gammaproteobacteria-6]
MFLKKTAIVLFASLMALPALAHEFSAGELFIDHPWSRAMPPSAQTGAAYLRIENRGDSADTLLGAETPVAAYTELHEHVHQDGLMKMQQVQRLSIEPAQALEFQPGGYHIMLFNLQQPLVAGEQFPLTLEFERAGKIDVIVNIDNGAQPSPAHEPAEMDMHEHKHH